MLSVFSIASAHPFKSDKELYDFYAEIDKKDICWKKQAYCYTISYLSYC